jgi:CBS domain-containing protein/ribosome-associated translation inhibitor RaiA
MSRISHTSIMKVSDIMADKVITVNLEDTVSKTLKLMYENNISHSPVVDEKDNFVGMISAKQFLTVNAMPSSKLKGFLTKTPMLNLNDSIEKSVELFMTTGNAALPVLEGGKLYGIVRQNDVLLTSDFGHAIVDQIMSGAIVVEDESTLSNALSKMRRYNISRLPVINSGGVLIGVLAALDVANLIAVPKERATKSPGVGTAVAIRDVKVKEIMRKAISVDTGTRLNAVIERFRANEEVIVTGNARPIGIITPKDALELILPKRAEPTIHIAHIDEHDTRREIEEQFTRFLKKIQGKLENVQLVIVYADKHKTHKYSLRARTITDKGVIDAKAVGYDPLSACKELISRLERRIKSDHSQKVKGKQHRDSSRSLSWQE